MISAPDIVGQDMELRTELARGQIVLLGRVESRGIGFKARNLTALTNLCASSTGIVKAHVGVKVIRDLGRGVAKPGVRNAVDKTRSQVLRRPTTLEEVDCSCVGRRLAALKGGRKNELR
jgi:hypothetical protein